MRAANVAGQAGTCIAGCSKYRTAEAPCVCVTGPYKHSTETVAGKTRLAQHGRIHRRFDLAEAIAALTGGWKYEGAKDAGSKAVCKVVPGCTKQCIEAQLDHYHIDQCGIKPDTPVRAHVGLTGKLREKAQRAIAIIKSAFGKGANQGGW